MCPRASEGRSPSFPGLFCFLCFNASSRSDDDPTIKFGRFEENYGGCQRSRTKGDWGRFECAEPRRGAYAGRPDREGGSGQQTGRLAIRTGRARPVVADRPAQSGALEHRCVAGDQRERAATVWLRHDSRLLDRHPGRPGGRARHQIGRQRRQKCRRL